MFQALFGAPRLLARGTFLFLLPFALACGAQSQGEPTSGEASDVRSPAEAPSLEPTFESPEALAKAIVDGFSRENGAVLDSYPLNEEQFRYYVWPQLPVSRPEVNMPFDYLWDDTHQKSHNALLRSFDRYKGQGMTLLEIQFEDGVTDYETYLVHRDARVKVRLEDGRETWLDLFGSVMEYQGRYKLFSYVTD